jgi:hypothetical protein
VARGGIHRIASGAVSVHLRRLPARLRDLRLKKADINARIAKRALAASLVAPQRSMQT